MGRRKKPTALKELAGNPGKRPLPKNEPRPDAGLPDKPKVMSRVASQEWDRLAPQLDKLGLLTSIDLITFVTYCESYSEYCAAKAHIKKYGRYQKVNGLWKRNPAIGDAKASAQQMFKFAEGFGLTPSSRAKVAAEMKNPAQPVLPGTGGLSVDPNKPEMPGLPTDAEYFDIQQTTH